MSSERATTTSSSIQSLWLKACMERTSTGTPQTSSNCLSNPFIRDALPAAGITADTNGFSHSCFDAILPLLPSFHPPARFRLPVISRISRRITATFERDARI